MRRFWQWRSDWMRPTREPRPGAPEAPPEFVHRLAADVREQRGRAMSRPAGFALRLALAATITLVMVASFAGFGSFSYAANNLKGTAKAAKGKIWSDQAQARNHGTLNDDDDDDGGGGGGGDDDDDDGGGGGGGGDDDDDDGGDDDDGDDDEYEEEEEECRDAIQTQRRAFHDQQHAAHRAFHRNPTGSHKAFHDQQRAERRAFNTAMHEARDDCDAIGGGGDDDDD